MTIPRAAGLVLAAVLVAGCTGSSRSNGAGDDRVGVPMGASRSELKAKRDALPACPSTTRRTPRTGGLPALRLPCLGHGPAVRLSDLRGEPMVLNVWAAWCTQCKAEAPYFADLHRRAGAKLRFFGIHYKAKTAYALDVAKDLGIFFPSVVDPSGSKTVAALKATAPPQTFFVTASGRVAHVQRGVITSQAMLDRLVDTYLGVHA